MHPIELSIVLAMVFPFAVARAWRAHESGSDSPLKWGAVLLIGMATMLPMARTGLIGIAITGGAMWLAWSWRTRLNAAMTALLFLCLTWATIPGLVGTLRGLFTRMGEDGSVQARIERLPNVIELVRDSPLLGHGLGVYNRDDFFLLDNQIFKTAIESGILGVLVVLGMIAIPIVVNVIVGQRSRDPDSRMLARAMAGALIAAGVSLATFDAFHYHIFRGTMFLLIGCSAALWRVERRRGLDTPARDVATPSRRWGEMVKPRHAGLS